MHLLKTLVLLLSSALAAGAETASPPEYYAGFYHNYRLPYQVSAGERLTENEAKKRSAYVVILRDNQGNIIDFKKYVNGELFIHHQYEYDADGTLKAHTDKLKSR